MNIASIKKSIMRNYSEEFPNRYRDFLEYENWEELEEFVDEIARKKKETRQ